MSMSVCTNCITVVSVMNGHPRDQAKVSVHDRWPFIGVTQSCQHWLQKQRSTAERSELPNFENSEVS